MIEIIGNKIELHEKTPANLADLYYWRFKEKGQEAKKWNGPYIPEKQMTKEEHEHNWMNEDEISADVPASLVIFAEGHVIGYVGSYWVDKNTDWLETGIVVYDKTYWNGGYGTEAYKLWINFLFASTDLHRLGMSTWSGNERMIRVAERLGMVQEACIRKARTVNGEYYDAIKMGMLREEWKGLNDE